VPLVSLTAITAVFGQSDYRADRLLIKPRTGVAAGAIEAFHAQWGVEVFRHFAAFDNLQALRLPEGVSVPSALAAYLQSGLVEFAEPDFLLHPAVTPNDPYYGNGALWHLHNTGQSGGVVDADIDGPEAWDTISSATDVIIAVVDTGIRYTHEDLAANMWRNPGETAGNGVDDDGNGFVDDIHGINAAANNGNPADLIGHGTRVAGLAGAVGNNGLGVIGVPWRVQLMACRFYDDDGVGSVSDAIQGIDYARANGVKVINASWISTNYASTLHTAINNCRSAGIIFVAAAGNSASDNDSLAYYPASYNLDNVVAVAATTRTDALVSSSNYGATSVDLAAPGAELTSTYISSDASYAGGTGTSFSAPIVAGALALLQARYPSGTYLQLIQRLYDAVDPLPGLSGKCVTGGRLNLARALGPALLADFDADPVSGSAPLTVKFTDKSYGEITSWSWTFGDGDSSNEPSPSHTYHSEGTFTVTLTILDALGRSSSKSTNIAVVANYQITSGTYSWVDPSGMTALSLSNDGVSSAQTLPFTFRFYGVDYTQLYVGANGVIGFANNSLSAGANADLPNVSTPNNLICPFWDDLNPGAGGSVRAGTVGSSPNRQFVISWVDVPYNANPPASYTFQAALEEGTHRIRFQYQSVAPGRGPGDQGKSATVGVENAAGTVAARYSYNGSTLLINNTAILFLPATTGPSPCVLTVSPSDGLSSSGPVGGPFSPASITCTLSNSGGSVLNWTASKSQSWVSLSTASGTLAAGASTPLTVSINAYAESFAAGIYGASVSIVNNSTAGDPFVLPVTLQVTTPLRFTACSGSDLGTCYLAVEGVAGAEIVLEASTDLAVWTSIATNQVASDGTVTFSDSASADLPKRWYRASTVP
jgi:subtilisin family serine protease